MTDQVIPAWNPSPDFEHLMPDVRGAITGIYDELSKPGGRMIWHPTYAAGECDWATGLLVDSLGRGDVAEASISSELGQVGWHIMAVFDGFLIDLTRRQFEPGAEFPWVKPIDAHDWSDLFVHQVPDELRPIAGWKSFEPIWQTGEGAPALMSLEQLAGSFSLTE